MSQDGFVVVIRAAGERTFEACRHFLLREVPLDLLHVVQERPLEAALRKCYRIGMESGAEWMVTVDADVLARAGGVAALLEVARGLPERYVKVEGLVHDKLRGGYREGGPYVYRVKHLPMALPAVPDAGTQIRPEFSTLQRLSSLGYPSFKCSEVLGIHDYEQFYRDLYRKAFVHGQKHSHWLAEVLPRWRQLADSDADFSVAMRGYCDGFQTSAVAPIDVRAYGDRAMRALTELGLEEKPGLETNPASMSAIEAIQDRVLETPRETNQDSIAVRVAKTYRKLGGLRLGMFVVGSLLNRVGDRFRRAAKRPGS